MPLDAANLAIVERWTGPLDGDGVTEADAVFDRLADAHGVALEILMRRRGQFAMEVADLASASDRANHSKNMEAIQAQIDRLLAAMGLLDLPAAVEDLLAEAEAGIERLGMAFFPYTAANPRLT